MKVTDFRDLRCWQGARELVRVIYLATAGGAFAKDYGLKDQIRRAAVSVMANIAEGFGTQSEADFMRYLSISIRSAYEVESHLYVAVDLNYLSQKDHKKMEALAANCIHLSKGLIRHLREKRQNSTQAPKHLGT